MSEGVPIPTEERVVMLAPLREEAAVWERILDEAGMAHVRCSDLSQVCRKIAAGAGAVVLAEEALAKSELDGLIEVLAAQPPWSALPILLLTRGDAESSLALWATENLGNAVLLQRPVAHLTFVSILRAAVNGRRRQYQLRQHLAERRRAEESLRESERRLRAFFDSNMVGNFFWSIDGHITDANDKFLQLVGYDREDLAAGRVNWTQITPPEHGGQDESAAAELKATGAVAPYEKEFNCKDGTRIPVLVGAATLDESRREGAGFVLDMTQRKQMESELNAARVSAERAKAAAEQANRAKDHFLAVLSHELRMPLTPVAMGLSMLQDRPDLDPAMRETLEMLRRNVEMEARLIDDLLDVTRIARGKIELQKQRVELCSVIERAVEVCKPDIDGRRLRFSVDLGTAAPCWVEADVSRLQQVFWNLLNNAIKFTPHGGCVGVRCRHNETCVVVEVNDNGIGMEPESLSRVFNAFEQVERSITEQFGGLGLGLAISKGLVEMHGGQIEAQSEGRGKGATFRVQLPLLAPAAKPETPAPAATPPREVRSLRILLVEDHGATAKMAEMVLTAEGHTVSTAGDMATALELVSQDDFDLLISDLGLPDGNGHDLMRQLRTRGFTFPGIALSGYGQEEDVRQSHQAGFAAHLTKPASLERMLETIDAVMAGQPSRATAESAVVPPTPSHAKPHRFDAPAALQQCFGKPHILRQMIDDFLTESPPLLGRVRLAAQRGDCAEVAASAHRLAGTLAFLRATEALKAAKNVERIGRCGDLLTAPEAIGNLERQLDALRDAVLQYLQTEPPGMNPQH